MWNKFAGMGALSLLLLAACVVTPKQDGSLSAAEQDCRGCHTPDKEPMLRHSHPIDVVYPGAKADLVAQPTLPLVDGRVVCVSCHEADGASQPPHGAPRQAMDGLCLNCHRL